MIISEQRLRVVERLVWVLTAVLAIYAGYLYLIPAKDGSSLYIGQVKPFEQESLEALLRQPEPFTEYTGLFESRSLFEDPLKEEPEPTAPPPAMVPQAALTFPEHLKIVGIVIGEPSEVIVEDTVQQTTLFLKPGDEQGDIRVKSIEQNMVIFNYLGQDIQVTIAQ